MGGGSDSAKQREADNAAAQLKLANENAALQKKIYDQISPFGNKLLNAGQLSLMGVAPDFLKNAILPGLESGFQGARQNMLNFFGRSGQGISGIAAGPFANEQNDEATAMSQANNQAIMQGIMLGQQGAGMLQGQQSVFNPVPYFQGTSQADQNIYQMSANPWAGILGGLAGSAIGALGGPIGSGIGKKIGSGIGNSIGGTGGGGAVGGAFGF